MAIPTQYREDVEAILAKRHDNGDDFWATPDGRWGTGSPFSTFDCALMLSELGMKRSDDTLRGVADRLLSAWREDGRFRPAPKGAIYPCHTANAARALCRLGHARDKRLVKSFDHLFEVQSEDGGWRCSRTRLGKSPETDASNPGVTLAALDAFRFTDFLNRDERLDRAVRFLLRHWTVKRPLGPCEFGIGTLFMQVEYPFLRYNLFFYAYVLSFYDSALEDPSFREALEALRSKLVDGKLVVENPNRRLARFRFCEKGRPSDLATGRYREILRNVGG